MLKRISSVTPRVVTSAVPGPLSVELSNEIGAFQESRSHAFVVDYANSQGNYITDVDGNTFLDVFGQISSMSLGYNSPDLVQLARTEEFIQATANRPALGMFPPKDFPALIQSSLLRVAPPGLKHVSTQTTGSDSNENAIKSAFLAYRARQRGDAPFTPEEIASSLVNEAPGCPELTVLSFKYGFHGRLLGSLSLTHSKPIHKLDIPAFDWPVAPFPELRYPLADHAAENEAEEARCLARVEEIIVEQKARHRDVAALIIEPILSEGGDRHASPAFFRGLRAITERHGVFFIVDEVQTGVGATGTFWAHEQWALPTPPDFVTFSKKMQAAGFFHRVETRASAPFRIFSTWMGDPVRLLQARTIIETIERDGLVAQARAVGKKLYSGLEELAAKYGVILNLRGHDSGTYIAFDLATPQARDAFLYKLKMQGVNMGGCGDAAVRLRPMLIFGEPELAILLAKIEGVLQEGA